MRSLINYIKEYKDDTRLVWIDDIRDPNQPKWQQWIEQNCPLSDPDYIYWVKSYKEFCDWVDKNGCPDCISFDHDLGDTSANEKTGYDCAKYMVDWCMDNDVKFPMYSIQSDNGPGRQNIQSYIENFKKHFK